MLKSRASSWRIFLPLWGAARVMQLQWSIFCLAYKTPGGVSGQSFGSQFGVNIGGGRQFSTEFQMDGMNVSYQGVSAGVPLDMRPDYDITSEVKVQIGVPTAEYRTHFRRCPYPTFPAPVPTNCMETQHSC